MKKVFCLFLTAVFLLMLGGCSNSVEKLGSGSNSVEKVDDGSNYVERLWNYSIFDEKDAVLPPCRIGAGIASASFAKDYNFETAFAEADAVARIKVGDWLAETDHVTYYEAAVLQCFKGDMPDIFTLIQDGCSDHTLKGYPLFTWGDEMLLFLDIGVDDKDLEFNSPYWIIGAFTTIFDVAYDKNGNRYYVDSYSCFGERTDIEKNYSDDAEVYESVYSWMCAADPLMTKAEGYHIPYIFSESDVLKLIDEY